MTYTIVTFESSDVDCGSMELAEEGTGEDVIVAGLEVAIVLLEYP